MKLYPSDKSFDELKPLNVSKLDLDKNTAGEQITEYRAGVLTGLGERSSAVIERLKNELAVLCNEKQGIIEENHNLSIEKKRLVEENQLLSAEQERLVDENQLLSAEKARLDEENQLITGSLHEMTTQYNDITKRLKKTIRHKRRYKRTVVILGLMIVMSICYLLIK